MPNPPRRQHFIPQFWQKRFSHNGTNMVWAYDVERHRVEERSIKSLMQIYDLYTEDPSAPSSESCFALAVTGHSSDPEGPT